MVCVQGGDYRISQGRKIFGSDLMEIIGNLEAQSEQDQLKDEVEDSPAYLGSESLRSK